MGACGMGGICVSKALQLDKRWEQLAACAYLRVATVVILDGDA